jgi:hypothetical protein
MNNTNFPSIRVHAHTLAHTHTQNYNLILIDILERASCNLFTNAEVKGKNVKVSQCFINYAPCHEDVWGNSGIAPPFLTLELDGGEWSASHPTTLPLAPTG